MYTGRNVISQWRKRFFNERMTVRRYGRLVGRVDVNGRDVNLAQIQAGLAWWYVAYAHEQSASERAAYEAAEVEAKRARQGLWRDALLVAPWDFRKATRSAAQPAVTLPVDP